MKINLKQVREKNIIIYNRLKIFFVVILGLILVIYYIRNVRNIYTVWEIEDESMYLYNASLFAGYDWKEVFGNSSSYYGWGYSLLLVPLFWICNTGVELIRGSIFVNILCIVVQYFLQIYLMKKILSTSKMVYLAIFSFLVCLYPYIASNSMKVVAEVFLTLMVWLVGLFLYNALKTQKIYHYILLGIFSSFIFFVHTRALFVMISCITIMIICLILKKISLRKFIIYIVIFLSCFLIFSIVKKEIIQTLGQGITLEKNENKIINTITVNYISDRIKWLFSAKNIEIYFTCAISKIFYLITSTAGLFLFGFSECIVSISKFLKKITEEIAPEIYLQLFFVISFMGMFTASCISGTGNTYVTYIYGRYYEFLAVPFVFMGLSSITLNNNSKKRYFLFFIITTIAGKITFNLYKFSNSEELKIDTNRYSGWSYAIKSNNYFFKTIAFLILSMMIIILIYYILQKHNVKMVLIPLLVGVYFLVINKVNISEINSVNEKCKSDSLLAEYIIQNKDTKDIYFVYEQYRYSGFYQRLQVHLKEQIVHIILPQEENKKSSFIITYKDTNFSKELKEKEYNYITSSEHFELFQK